MDSCCLDFGQLRGSSEPDSPGSSPAVQRRSSARLAKKLDDAAMKTPKSQGQGTGPTSLALNPSRFKDVVGDNILNVTFKTVV